jgi:UDP-glucose:(heptosyl)LPS alpha-1,3-glucosyltransferase
MRIALVVHDLHEHGGHSLYTQILANGLSRDHEVAVFANRCERPPDAHWESVHVRAWRNSALACVQTFPLGLRSHSPKLAAYDICHMQGYCGGYPNVVTAHICVSAYLNSLRSISISNRASLKLMAAAERRFYRRYEGPVIAISDKIARELREYYQVSGDISVIPHGVDTTRFGSRQRDRYRSCVRSGLGLEEQKTMALYVGDLTKAHVHLRALARAAPQVQFIIVSGSKKYRWQMANVRFLPPTCTIERYYAAADVFVFPTTYDSFGMVVLEAMAAGLPVFSSDCAGAAELIQSGHDGFVAPLEEWTEITSAALREPERLRQIGHTAEQSAIRYGWSTVVRRVEQLYEKTLVAELAT